MQLSYGHNQIEFKLDSTVQWQVLSSQVSGAGQGISIEPAIDELASLIKARVRVAGARLLLVIPDHTRRCRVDEILRSLMPKLESLPSPVIHIVVANGSHVLQPEATVRDLVGADIYDRYAVQQHDSQNQEALHYFGATDYGTPVFLNKLVKEADVVVAIGGILFHYFAGFGGGAKMLLPGVAGYETIRINHRRTIDEANAGFHHGCREGQLDGNPVFMDLAQVDRMVPDVISLQVVLNPQKEFVYAEAGPMLAVHRRACQVVKATYSLPLSAQADVVVASAGGFPSDVNLVQAHKSIHHAFRAVKPGGNLVMLAECREGAGSKTFMPCFAAGDSIAIGRQLLANYQINGQTALALKAKTEQVQIHLVSSLDPGLVRKTGMIPHDSLDKAWHAVQARLPVRASGYIFPKASVYLPVLEMERD
jgi:nickel-dependent lactate racemase